MFFQCKENVVWLYQFYECLIVTKNQENTILRLCMVISSDYTECWIQAKRN